MAFKRFLTIIAMLMAGSASNVSTAQIAMPGTLKLPTDIDLKAAYCLGTYKEVLAADFSQSPDRSISQMNQKKAGINRDRIQAYLLPRLLYLDSTGIVVANSRGINDSRDATDAMGRCLSTCGPQSECVIKCANDDPAMIRVKSCSDPSFLPF